MKDDELANPEPVGLFRAGAEMPASADGRDLIEQARAAGGVVTP